MKYETLIKNKRELEKLLLRNVDLEDYKGGQSLVRVEDSQLTLRGIDIYISSTHTHEAAIGKTWLTSDSCLIEDLPVVIEALSSYQRILDECEKRMLKKSRFHPPTATAREAAANEARFNNRPKSKKCASRKKS